MNYSKNLKDQRNKYLLLRAGNIILWIFVITTVVAIWHYVPVLYHAIRDRNASHLWEILLVAGAEFLIFWIGIIIVYITSRQLGFKTRLLGIVFGMIPLANLTMLILILRIPAIPPS